MESIYVVFHREVCDKHVAGAFDDLEKARAAILKEIGTNSYEELPGMVNYDEYYRVTGPSYRAYGIQKLKLNEFKNRRPF